MRNPLAPHNSLTTKSKDHSHRIFKISLLTGVFSTLEFGWEKPWQLGAVCSTDGHRLEDAVTLNTAVILNRAQATRSPTWLLITYTRNISWRVQTHLQFFCLFSGTTRLHHHTIWNSYTISGHNSPGCKGTPPNPKLTGCSVIHCSPTPTGGNPQGCVIPCHCGTA